MGWKYWVVILIMFLGMAILISNNPEEDMTAPTMPAIALMNYTPTNYSEVFILLNMDFFNYVNLTENQQLIAENEELQKQIKELQKQVENRKIYGKTFDAPGDWIKANQLIVSGGIATIEGVDYLENEFHGDSMMPFIASGDTHSIVLLKRLSAQEKDKLVIGDIIVYNGYSNKLKITAEGTFRSPERIRTMHRIVDINTSADKCFITKGDTYEGADYYCVLPADVEAVVVGGGILMLDSEK